MTVWNVALPVIANLQADTAEEAVARLYAALDGAGFTVYSDSSVRDVDLSPFEADEATEAETLPGEVTPRRGGWPSGWYPGTD